jgi:hypothetical protein
MVITSGEALYWQPASIGCLGNSRRDLSGDAVLTDVLNGFVEIAALLLAAGEVPKPTKAAWSVRLWARCANTSECVKVEPSR